MRSKVLGGDLLRGLYYNMIKFINLLFGIILILIDVNCTSYWTEIVLSMSI